jgi:hypothetical protein
VTTGFIRNAATDDNDFFSNDNFFTDINDLVRDIALNSGNTNTNEWFFLCNVCVLTFYLLDHACYSFFW